MERNDSPVSSPRKLKLEQLKADYELFLQTFEKPTLIYRYLRARHTLAPVFLHRTLSYLKGRKKVGSNPNRKRRKDAKCIELLADKEKLAKLSPRKAVESSQDSEEPSEKHHLNLRFNGFFHGPNLSEELAQSVERKVLVHLHDDFVQVNVNLLKLFHKRRKDENMPMESVSLGSCKAPCNPRSELFNNGPTFSISIPSDVFSEATRSVKTFILSIQLTLNVTQESLKQKPGRKSKSDVLYNIENGTKSDQQDGEAVESRMNGGFSDFEAQTPKGPGRSKIVSIPYSAEMIVFDKHKAPLLIDGDYELLLQRTDLDEIPEKENWEGEFSKQLGAFNLFSFGPTIKFHLEWDLKPMPVMHLSKATSPRKKKDIVSTPCESLAEKECLQQRIFYQFIYSNNTKQQTEARDDCYCPWCMVNCVQLYCLLKHLRLNHMRFSFIYTPTNKGARIDVCLNENFDSSATKRRSLGGPQLGVLRGEGPIKQTSETQILVSKAAPVNGSLNEFLEPEYNELESSDRANDRVYYRTDTCLPLLSQELDCNNEDEKDPAWIKEKTKFMIDEFTDVNPGEKELTKMWNIHILAEGYIADFQMTIACQSFVKKYGQDIVKKGLERNFLLHLCSLADFGLLPLGSLQPLTASLKTIGNEE